MSERYSKVFSLPENLYAEGAPVVIAAGALLKDNQTGRVVAQLKLRNISPKTIKAVTVRLFPMNTAGQPLGDAVRYEYLDLSSNRDADFGSKSAIPMPDKTTRSFSIRVAEVIFADNSAWSDSNVLWEPLKKPEALDSRLDSEMVKQFRMEHGARAKNFLLEQKDLWHCICGAVNRQGETVCHSCQESIYDLKNLDLEALKEHKEQRLAKEQEQAERKAAATQKNIKVLATVLVVAAVFCIVASFVVDALKKNNAYNEAALLMEQGKYEEAIEAFTALDGYRDSAEQIQAAKNAIADMERAAEYDRAIQLLESGKSENENEAYHLLTELGDYGDAKNLLEHFTYACIASDNVPYEYDNVRYEYDLSGNLIEENYGSYCYLYGYEDGHVVWEGPSENDWSKTYTYYPNGMLKSQTECTSRSQPGAIGYKTVYYSEKGWPETVMFMDDDEPDAHRIWQCSYTLSDNSLISELLCSFQDYGKTQKSTWSVDFTEYGGFLSDIQFDFGCQVYLSIANANKTHTEEYVLGYIPLLDHFYMWKRSEESFMYDTKGRIVSKTTSDLQQNQERTTHYSYDSQGNLIEKRSDASENTDNRLYLTTYTYGYIYTPDAK